VTRSHIALFIAGLVLLSGSACGIAQMAALQPTPTKQTHPLRTLVPTFTPSPDATATPTPTDTPTDTPTPTVTSTPTETATPTDTPRPANTPKPAVPTDTPTPTAPAATPTPEVDFVVTKQDVMKIIENGSCNWRQNIFVDVVDAGDKPINGLIVSDKWNNLTHVTGDKGPGKVVFDLWKNSLELFVKSDESGKPFRSQTTRRLSSDKPEISDMIKGGVCANEAECQAKIASNSFCYGHYAYEVTFKRTW
jgi:hypothetical protein